MTTRLVESWGRLGKIPHHVVTVTDPSMLQEQIRGPARGLAYGMGRSYGDVCLNPDGLLWQTAAMDHLIRFNADTGELSCEAGVQLRDIQRLLTPRGWMLPVTPGTQFVTVGGAIANDVHGKNHHVMGSFGGHVRRLVLVRTDGSRIECGPQLRPDWFRATIGGLGLTGVISEVDLQLRRVHGPWLQVETLPYVGLDRFFELSEASAPDWEYTVSWIDCLAGPLCKGIFMRGNHAVLSDRDEPRPRKLSMPLTPPFSLVQPFTLRPFNLLYHAAQSAKAGTATSHYEPFFYPLDHIRHWNRMYGPRGFYQYQSVVPSATAHEATREMLKAIALSGEGSFLAVLKTFGPGQGAGMLSFPQPGATIALDFPNNGARTTRLFKTLDAIVRGANGRIYMAKDARMPRDLFESGYPRHAEFGIYRDPGISSGLSRRLMGW